MNTGSCRDRIGIRPSLFPSCHSSPLPRIAPLGIITAIESRQCFFTAFLSPPIYTVLLPIKVWLCQLQNFKCFGYEWDTENKQEKTSQASKRIIILCGPDSPLRCVLGGKWKKLGKLVEGREYRASKVPGSYHMSTVLWTQRWPS